MRCTLGESPNQQRPRRHNLLAFMGVTEFQLPVSYRTTCVYEDRTMYVFRAMTCSHLARPRRSAPTEKGPIDNISSRKYTIHYRATDIHPCFYHRLTSSFVPSTGHSISSSQIPHRAPHPSYSPASAESLSSGIATGTELATVPLSADLSMHAAPFIVLVLDLILCEPKVSRRQMNRVAPVVIPAYGV